MSGCEAKVPALRFRGYPGAWEKNRLGEFGDCQSGEGFSEIEQGGKVGIPFFKVSDMNLPGNESELVAANNYVTDEQIKRCVWHPVEQLPAVFFAKVGAAVLLNRKRIVRIRFLLDNNTMAFRLHDSINPDFAKSLFDTIDLPALSQTGALPSINASDVEDVQCYSPSLPEQRRIGSLLRSLDALIAGREKALEKLEALKKSMLLKMFPQGDATVPEVRFKGFTGDWEKKRLGEWLSVADNENRDGRFTATDVLSVSGDYGVVNQIEFQGRSFAGVSLKHYRILMTNQVVYTKSPLKRAPFGIVKANLFKDGIVSALYGVYDLVGSDSAFIQFYFESLPRLNNYFRPLVNKGAKNTLLINDEDAISGEVIFPSLPEQQKIGAYFRSLDALLASRREEIGKLKQMKKALLERMFV